MKTSIGQGHGIAGRYLGLPDEFALLESSKIVLLPVSFDLTSTYQKGADLGPNALIEASRHLELYDIETDSEVYKKGIFTAPMIQEQSSEKMLEKTYRDVTHYIKNKKFVVTVGGEHSISLAAIKAHADQFPDLTIVQFDAHADLQNSYEGDPYSHACVMARVKELPNIKKIVSIGIRSMSQEELCLVDQPNTFFAHAVAENPYWMEAVLDQISGPIYITFDLDVFDPSIMPSTGTPEPGGLLWNQAMKILRQMSERFQIVGFDVVELLPKKDNPAPDFLAAKLIYKILSYQFIKES